MKTELCKLFEKYKADKCPSILHTYSPVYFNLLKGIQLSVKNVLEIGIGTIPIMTNVGIKDYVPGASIRGWRDFFPNATVYGVDIEESVMFTDDRIVTDVVDQSSVDSIRKFTNKVNKKFDFIIDDGSHLIDHIIISIYELTNNLNSNGIYIIEDIHQSYLNILNEIKFPGLTKIHTHYGTKDIWDNFIAFQKDNDFSIPKILHLVWVGEKEKPQYFLDNLNRWKSLMPDWTYMIWTNDKITEEYFDEEYLEIMKRIKSPAQLSDFIRFYVLNKYGGYYADADVTPIRSLENILNQSPVILCNDLPDDYNTPNYMACAFVAGMPNHPLWEACINECKDIDVSLPYNKNSIPTGPYVLGNCVRSKINWSNIDGYTELPYWYFYRNRIGDPGPTMPNRIERDHPDAIGNHTYLGTWL